MSPAASLIEEEVIYLVDLVQMLLQSVVQY
jgi:hypothetical protein